MAQWFGSYHPHDSLQPSVAPVPGDLVPLLPLWAPGIDAEHLHYAGKTLTTQNKINKSVKTKVP